jgi:hypothetical protein
MPKSQQSWVRSQHPPADEAVLNTVHREKKFPCANPNDGKSCGFLNQSCSIRGYYLGLTTFLHLRAAVWPTGFLQHGQLYNNRFCVVSAPACLPQNRPGSQLGSLNGLCAEMFFILYYCLFPVRIIIRHKYEQKMKQFPLNVKGITCRAAPGGQPCLHKYVAFLGDTFIKTI